MTGNSSRADAFTAAPGSGAATVWRLGERTLDFSARPLVMGILNLTPDSFHAASRVTLDTAVATAHAMAEAGADLLDLGAESSRPGAQAVTAAEEQDRLLPALERIRATIDLPLTIDTTHAQTACLAVDAGADGINDISAGRADRAMFDVVAETSTGLVLMHMQNSPPDMQLDPQYEDVVAEVATFLGRRHGAAVATGITHDRILIDPGIGFGKSLAHNLRLMASLEDLNSIAPVLLGASRKSFIGRLTGAGTGQRLGGSLAAAAIAHNAGAAVVRVHDVGDTRQLFDVLTAVAASSS